MCTAESDIYLYIWLFVFQRQSNQSSATSQNQQQSTSSKSNPYQSQLYDSWRTEWNAPYYDQYRSGPSGASSSAEAVNHSGGGRSAYMTKGGRRLSYEDDFWYRSNWMMKVFFKSINFFEITEKIVQNSMKRSIQCKSSTKTLKKNSWKKWFKWEQFHFLWYLIINQTEKISLSTQWKKWKKTVSCLEAEWVCKKSVILIWKLFFFGFCPKYECVNDKT